MGITRPTGEQLRFRSQYTGDHILDTYLEAAEKGSRTLPDLLDDLFDASGVFRDENFEFRYDTTTKKIQFRAGNYANSGTGWNDVTTFFNIRGTFNSSTTYQNFDLITLSTKDVYITHGLTSGTTFAHEDALIASANTTKIVDVSEARDWASKTNGQVASTDYSAKAYAVGGTGVDTTAGSAKDWAIKTGSAVGNTGEMSAKYWATHTNVTTVATNIANINTTAGSIANVNTVAGSIANVNTTASNIANVNTVAGELGSGQDVTVVAANIANVTTTSGSIANVNTTAGSIANVNTVSGSISSVNSVAANITGVNSFADRYRVGSSDPTSSLDEGDLFFNTTVDRLKVYTGTFWNIIDPDGLPLTGGTITGNLTVNGDFTLTGANYNVVWDKSDNALEFGDNAKAVFGAGGDLSIFHDGSSSVIRDSGTGNLALQAEDFAVQSADASATHIFVDASSGYTSLGYGGVAKIATSASGVTVTGAVSPTTGVTLDDNVNLTLGTGSDTTIDFDGSSLAIRQANDAQDTYFYDASGNARLRLDTDQGDLHLYNYDSGTDGPNLILKHLSGSPADGDTLARMYFVGKNSADEDTYYSTIVSMSADVTDGNEDGDLYLQVLTDGVNKNYITVNSASDKAVTLRYDGSSRLATTSAGVDVTGTVTMDGGSTSADFNFGDSDKALFGAGNDLQLYHDGTNSFILENGTGNLIVKGNAGIYLRGTNDENMATFLQDGAVTLYHDNTARIATTSAGVDVTGTVTMDGGSTSADFSFADDISAKFGAGDDLKIYHTGGHSYIYDAGDGYLVLMSNGPGIRLNSSSAEVMVDAVPDGAVTLYHNNTARIATTSTGAAITGNATVGDTVSAYLDIGGDLSTGNARVEIGTGRSGNGYSWIDLVGDTTYTDYGLRIIRYQTGANAPTTIEHRGTGNFTVKSTEAADILFQTTNAERMRIQAGGNVGIATAAPAQKLEVGGVVRGTYTQGGIPSTFWSQNTGYFGVGTGGVTSEGSYAIHITSNGYRNSSAQWTSLGANGQTGAAQIGLYPPGYIAFGTEATKSTGDTSVLVDEKMRLTAGGSLGIGTSAPGAQLHVSNATQATMRLQDSGGTNQYGQMYHNSGSTYFSSRNASSHGQFYWYSYNGTDNLARMNLSASGRLGIGTTSPATRLQIGDNTVSTENVVKFGERVATSQTNLPLIGQHSHDGAANGLGINATSSGGAIHFFTGNDAAGFGTGSNAEQMRISAAGIVSQYNQPCFSVYKSTNDEQMNFAEGEWVTITYDTERFDVGSDFDLTNNKFVAPVDGKYLLSCVFYLVSVDAAPTYYGVKIQTSNQGYITYFNIPGTTDQSYWTAPFSFVAEMDAGDEATCQVYQQESGTEQTDLRANANMFSGYLLG